MDVAEVQLKADSTQITKADKALQGFNRTAKKTETTSEKMQKQNDSAVAGFKKMAIGAAKLAGGFFAVSTAMKAIGGGVRTIREFEMAMDGVAAISRATADEMVRMTQVARELGATTAFSATEAAEGMKFLAQAGFTAEQAISAIPDVLNLARAAAMDLGTAADIASNVMSGFGIAATDAGAAADILAGISSRANTNVQQLGDAAKMVGPVASAMGISLGDAAAAIGVLSDAGLQGTMAGTGLRRVLSSLANPTADATAVLKNLGVEISEVNPATNDLTDVIDRLAATGMSAADALTIFGDRGGPAILALTANAPRVGELADQMKNVNGEAARMAEVMGDNLDGDIKELYSAFSELAIQLGEAGITDAMRGFVKITIEAVRVTGFLVDEVRALFGSVDDDDYIRLGKQLAEIEHAMDGTVNRAQLEILQKQWDEIHGKMEAVHKLTTEGSKDTEDANEQWSFNLDGIIGKLKGVEVGVLAAYKEASGRESEEAIKAAEEFADSLQKIKDAANPAAAEARRLTEEYEIMRRAMESGQASTEDWADFMDYALPEVVVNVKKITTETDNLAKQSKEMETVYTRGIERMRDVTGDFFQSMLRDGELSFSGILDMFKDMVAEMIATAATNDIFSAFGLGSGSGGGLLDLAKSVFGGGSGGGDAGGGSGGLLGLAGTAKSIYGGAQSAIAGFQADGFAGAWSALTGGSGSGGLAALGGVDSSGIASGWAASEAVAGTGIPGLNYAVPGDGGAALAGGEGASGFSGWAAAGWAALIVGITRTFDDISSGLYDFSDVLTGQGLGIKYGDEVNEIIPGLGDLWVDLSEGARKFTDAITFGGFSKVFGQGGSSNAAGGGFVDLGTGESEAEGIGNSFSSKNVDALSDTNDMLLNFGDLIGGSSAKFEMWLGRVDGFRSKYIGDAEGRRSIETKNPDDFFDFAFDKIIQDATDLSDGLIAELRAFEGSTEELFEFTAVKIAIRDLLRDTEELTPAMVHLAETFDGTLEAELAFAQGMVALATTIADSPIQRAVEDFATAQETAALSVTATYMSQIQVVNEMIATYDGSFEATTTLNAALNETQASAYAMALGIESVRQSMDQMLGESAKSIRESVMSQDEIFDIRTGERDDIFASLGGIEDAGKLQEAITEANRLNTQLFGMLDDPTEAQAEEYATYAEDLARVSDERLDGMLERLEETQTSQMKNVTDSLELYATRQEMTAEAFADAVEAFAAAVRSGPNGSSNEVIV